MDNFIRLSGSSKSDNIRLITVVWQKKDSLTGFKYITAGVLIKEDEREIHIAQSLNLSNNVAGVIISIDKEYVLSRTEILGKINI